MKFKKIITIVTFTTNLLSMDFNPNYNKNKKKIYFNNFFEDAFGGIENYSPKNNNNNNDSFSDSDIENNNQENLYKPNQNYIKENFTDRDKYIEKKQEIKNLKKIMNEKLNTIKKLEIEVANIINTKRPVSVTLPFIKKNFNIPFYGLSAEEKNTKTLELQDKIENIKLEYSNDKYNLDKLYEELTTKNRLNFFSKLDGDLNNISNNGELGIFLPINESMNENNLSLVKTAFVELLNSIKFDDLNTIVNILKEIKFIKNLSLKDKIIELLRKKNINLNFKYKTLINIISYFSEDKIKNFIENFSKENWFISLGNLIDAYSQMHKNKSIFDILCVIKYNNISDSFEIKPYIDNENNYYLVHFFEKEKLNYLNKKKYFHTKPYIDEENFYIYKTKNRPNGINDLIKSMIKNKFKNNNIISKFSNRLDNDFNYSINSNLKNKLNEIKNSNSKDKLYDLLINNDLLRIKYNNSNKKIINLSTLTTNFEDYLNNNNNSYIPTLKEKFNVELSVNNTVNY